MNTVDRTKLKWYFLKLKNGDVLDIDENQKNFLLTAISKKYSERPLVFKLDEDTIIAIDSVATITVDKETLNR